MTRPLLYCSAASTSYNQNKALVDDSCSPRQRLTRESLTWFRQRREEWERAPRLRILPLPISAQSKSNEEEKRDSGSETAFASTKIGLSHKNADGVEPAEGSVLGTIPAGALAADSITTSSASSPKQDNYRDRLVAFYRRHNHQKLTTVDQTLLNYAGREDELFAKLQAKYSMESLAQSDALNDGCLPAEGTGPLCFLEVAGFGRLEVELFQDKVPIACQNFLELCRRQCYKDCPIHRIVPNFCIQTGDYTLGNGTGGKSIYPPNQPGISDLWGNFIDERPFLRHDKAGLLSMANNGPNRNSSQFFITLRPLPHLNGKHVVFGKIVHGMDVVNHLAQLDTNPKTQRPLINVNVTNCGELETSTISSEVDPGKYQEQRLALNANGKLYFDCEAGSDAVVSNKLNNFEETIISTAAGSHVLSETLGNSSTGNSLMYSPSPFPSNLSTTDKIMKQASFVPSTVPSPFSSFGINTQNSTPMSPAYTPAIQVSFPFTPSDAPTTSKQLFAAETKSSTMTAESPKFEIKETTEEPMGAKSYPNTPTLTSLVPTNFGGAATSEIAVGIPLPAIQPSDGQRPESLNSLYKDSVTKNSVANKSLSAITSLSEAPSSSVRCDKTTTKTLRDSTEMPSGPSSNSGFPFGMTLDSQTTFTLFNKVESSTPDSSYHGSENDEDKSHTDSDNDDADNDDYDRSNSCSDSDSDFYSVDDQMTGDIEKKSETRTDSFTSFGFQSQSNNNAIFGSQNYTPALTFGDLAKTSMLLPNQDLPTSTENTISFFSSFIDSGGSENFTSRLLPSSVSHGIALKTVPFINTPHDNAADGLDMEALPSKTSLVDSLGVMKVESQTHLSSEPLLTSESLIQCHSTDSKETCNDRTKKDFVLEATNQIDLANNFTITTAKPEIHSENCFFNNRKENITGGLDLEINIVNDSAEPSSKSSTVHGVNSYISLQNTSTTFDFEQTIDTNLPSAASTEASEMKLTGAKFKSANSPNNQATDRIHVPLVNVDEGLLRLSPQKLSINKKETGTGCFHDNVHSAYDTEVIQSKQVEVDVLDDSAASELMHAITGNGKERALFIRSSECLVYDEGIDMSHVEKNTQMILQDAQRLENDFRKINRDTDLNLTNCQKGEQDTISSSPLSEDIQKELNLLFIEKDNLVQKKSSFLPNGESNKSCSSKSHVPETDLSSLDFSKSQPNVTEMLPNIQPIGFGIESPVTSDSVFNRSDAVASLSVATNEQESVKELRGTSGLSGSSTSQVETAAYLVDIETHDKKRVCNPLSQTSEDSTDVSNPMMEGRISEENTPDDTDMLSGGILSHSSTNRVGIACIAATSEVGTAESSPSLISSNNVDSLLMLKIDAERDQSTANSSSPPSPISFQVLISNVTDATSGDPHSRSFIVSEDKIDLKDTDRRSENFCNAKVVEELESIDANEATFNENVDKCDAASSLSCNIKNKLVGVFDKALSDCINDERHSNMASSVAVAEQTTREKLLENMSRVSHIPGSSSAPDSSPREDVDLKARKTNCDSLAILVDNDDVVCNVLDKSKRTADPDICYKTDNQSENNVSIQHDSLLLENDEGEIGIIGIPPRERILEQGVLTTFSMSSADISIEKHDSGLELCLITDAQKIVTTENPARQAESDKSLIPKLSSKLLPLSGESLIMQDKTETKDLLVDKSIISYGCNPASSKSTTVSFADLRASSCSDFVAEIDDPITGTAADSINGSQWKPTSIKLNSHIAKNMLKRLGDAEVVFSSSSPSKMEDVLLNTRPTSDDDKGLSATASDTSVIEKTIIENSLGKLGSRVSRIPRHNDISQPSSSKDVSLLVTKNDDVVKKSCDEDENSFLVEVVRSTPAQNETSSTASSIEAQNEICFDVQNDLSPSKTYEMTINTMADAAILTAGTSDQSPINDIELVLEITEYPTNQLEDKELLTSEPLLRVANGGIGEIWNTELEDENERNGVIFTSSSLDTSNSFELLDKMDKKIERTNDDPCKVDFDDEVERHFSKVLMMKEGAIDLNVSISSSPVRKVKNALNDSFGSTIKIDKIDGIFSAEALDLSVNEEVLLETPPKITGRSVAFVRKSSNNTVLLSNECSGVQHDSTDRIACSGSLSLQPINHCLHSKQVQTPSALLSNSVSDNAPNAVSENDDVIKSTIEEHEECYTFERKQTACAHGDAQVFECCMKSETHEDCIELLEDVLLSQIDRGTTDVSNVTMEEPLLTKNEIAEPAISAVDTLLQVSADVIEHAPNAANAKSGTIEHSTRHFDCKLSHIPRFNTKTCPLPEMKVADLEKMETKSKIETRDSDISLPKQISIVSSDLSNLQSCNFEDIERIVDMDGARSSELQLREVTSITDGPNSFVDEFGSEQIVPLIQDLKFKEIYSTSKADQFSESYTSDVYNTSLQLTLQEPRVVDCAVEPQVASVVDSVIAVGTIHDKTGSFLNFEEQLMSRASSVVRRSHIPKPKNRRERDNVSCTRTASPFSILNQDDLHLTNKTCLNETPNYKQNVDLSNNESACTERGRLHLPSIAESHIRRSNDEASATHSHAPSFDNKASEVDVQLLCTDISKHTVIVETESNAQRNSANSPIVFGEQSSISCNENMHKSASAHTSTSDPVKCVHHIESFQDEKSNSVGTVSGDESTTYSHCANPSVECCSTSIPHVSTLLSTSSDHGVAYSEIPPDNLISSNHSSHSSASEDALTMFFDPRSESPSRDDQLEFHVESEAASSALINKSIDTAKPDPSDVEHATENDPISRQCLISKNVFISSFIGKCDDSFYTDLKCPEYQIETIINSPKETHDTCYGESLGEKESLYIPKADFGSKSLKLDVIGSGPACGASAIREEGNPYLSSQSAVHSVVPRNGLNDEPNFGVETSPPHYKVRSDSPPSIVHMTVNTRFEMSDNSATCTDNISSDGASCCLDSTANMLTIQSSCTSSTNSVIADADNTDTLMTNDIPCTTPLSRSPCDVDTQSQYHFPLKLTSLTGAGAIITTKADAPSFSFGNNSWAKTKFRFGTGSMNPHGFDDAHLPVSGSQHTMPEYFISPDLIPSKLNNSSEQNEVMYGTSNIPEVSACEEEMSDKKITDTETSKLPVIEKDLDAKGAIPMAGEVSEGYFSGEVSCISPSKEKVAIQCELLDEERQTPVPSSFLPKNTDNKDDANPFVFGANSWAKTSITFGSVAALNSEPFSFGGFKQAPSLITTKKKKHKNNKKVQFAFVTTPNKASASIDFGMLSGKKIQFGSASLDQADDSNVLLDAQCGKDSTFSVFRNSNDTESDSDSDDKSTGTQDFT